MQRAPIQSFSTSEALDLLRQGSGSAYFVPTGYIPILVPDSDEDPDILRHLLEPHVPPQVPVDNLWQTRLPTKVMRTKRKRTERPGATKKPPRPPNAFILYRKDKQVGPSIPLFMKHADTFIRKAFKKRKQGLRITRCPKSLAICGSKNPKKLRIIINLSRNKVGNSINETILATSMHQDDQGSESVEASITKLYSAIPKRHPQQRSL